MTRILHILETASLHYGGPVEATRRIGEVWARDGHVQDLLTLDPPEERHLTDHPGRIVQIGSPRDGKLLNRYRYTPRMVSWLKAHAGNYDAVICSGLWRYQARGTAQALVGGSVPYFVFTHGMLDPWFRKAAPLKHWGKQLSWLFAEGPLLNNARGVLFTTEEERVLAQDAFWPYRIRAETVNYGTADVTGEPSAQIAAFRAVVPALGERRYLLFLSRIHPKKGCDLLIDGFAAISAEQPDLDLVIAGPDQVGLVARLRAQAERLGIGARVHFPGMLEGDVKTGAFRAAEAFALTSHQENFGIVVAEALACGTPVLISDKVNIWREIASDRCGLVAPDTIEGAQSLMRQFAALTREDLTAMHERARSSFLARFHVERSARTLMALIEARI